MIAFADRVQRQIDEGHFADRADAARCLALTRPRVTQLLKLATLAPDIQEELLFLEAVDGVEPPVTERSLRGVVREVSWAAQRRLWAARPAVTG